MDLPDLRGKICLIGRPLYSVRMELVWLYPPTLDGKRGAMCQIVTLLRIAQLIEHWSCNPGSRVRIPVGAL